MSSGLDFELFVFFTPFIAALRVRHGGIDRKTEITVHVCESRRGLVMGQMVFGLECWRLELEARRRQVAEDYTTPGEVWSLSRHGSGYLVIIPGTVINPLPGYALLQN